MEFDLVPNPPATPACGPTAGQVRGSLAIHPRRGPALVTCFHGTALMASGCLCGNNHQAFVHINDAEFPVQVLEFDQRRDVAWISWPQIFPVMNGFARKIETTTPNRNDYVIVCSSVGNFLHGIADLIPREPCLGSPLELQLQPTYFGVPTQQTQDAIQTGSFGRGQSGSAVLNLNNAVIAVVRDTGGRCGLLQPADVV